jgi:hypothetical protein
MGRVINFPRDTGGTASMGATWPAPFGDMGPCTFRIAIDDTEKWLRQVEAIKAAFPGAPADLFPPGPNMSVGAGWPVATICTAARSVHVRASAGALEHFNTSIMCHRRDTGIRTSMRAGDRFQPTSHRHTGHSHAPWFLTGDVTSDDSLSFPTVTTDPSAPCGDGVTYAVLGAILGEVIAAVRDDIERGMAPIVTVNSDSEGGAGQ